MVETNAAAPAVKDIFRREILEEGTRRLNETRAVTALRRRALEIFSATPLPGDAVHLWRYTRPERLLPSGPPEWDPGPEEGRIPPGGEPFLRVLPGRPPLVRPGGEAAQKGVRVLPLGQVPPTRSRLGERVPPEMGLMEALNGAFWTSGLLLEIPPGVVLEEPLGIQVPAGRGPRLPRIAVRAGRDSRATVVEEHSGGKEGAKVVSVTELFLEEGASLSWFLFQTWEKGVSGHLTQRAALEERAELFSLFATLGGDCFKADLGTLLLGKGARSETAGFTLTEGKAHVDHHTEHRHLAGETRSDMDIRAVLGDESRAVYTGLIRIEEGCPGTEAYQEARNLLLSQKARAETIPELEILTDDVRCSHGAATSPVPEEEVFYMESRGLSREEALRLYVGGFFRASLNRIPPSSRDTVEGILKERIERTGS